MNILKRGQLKIHRTITRPLNLIKMKRLGIEFLPPNYVFFDIFNENSVIVDVGCGHEAEFVKHMLDKHKLKAFGIDPTRKHSLTLKQLEELTSGKFQHLPIAVSKENTIITFYESMQNESGSILLDHTNVRKDELVTYDVESVNLNELVRRIGATTIDFIKLDLEGAEYGLLEKISEKDVSPFKQIFIEFHHHCTDHTINETNRIVQRIRNNGFAVYTLDYHNYLFYKE